MRTGNRVLRWAVGLVGAGALGGLAFSWPISEDHILIYQTCRAERVTVVPSGGGYFPVAVPLQNGEVAAVLRGGAPHMGIKGRLDLVFSKDYGRTWTAPRAVAEGPGDHRNPAFGQLADGTLVLAYIVGAGYDETGVKLAKAFRTDGPFVIRSYDSGKTWTKPSKIPRVYPQQLNNTSAYGKIIQLVDGTALMATYYQTATGQDSESYICRSKDGGKTWGDPSLIARGFNETALAVMPEGRLIAAMRSRDNAPHLAVTHSTDKGYTWSTPVTVTAGREAPGDFIVLKGGTLLLTYGVSHVPRGVRALLSHDEGKTWNQKLILADDLPCNGEGGYPSSIELPGRRVFTVYYRVNTGYKTELTPEVLWKSLDDARALGVIWEIPQGDGRGF